MHSLFTTVDTLDASTYLHSVVQPNNSFALQWILPVTGFQDSGHPVTPPGFDKDYSMYLTIDASGILGTDGAPNLYTGGTVTLWADPKNDVGTASATVQNAAAFSGSTANDIVLATGTLVSATMSLDSTTGVRSAVYVEDITPTLDGTVLSGGSIQPGSQLTEDFTTPADSFQALPQPIGTTVDLVNGGRRSLTAR
jgi:hypothetical protein